jgi:hypothetical protein
MSRWLNEPALAVRRAIDHRTLDDAIEQGALFCNMLREHLGGAA